MNVCSECGRKILDEVHESHRPTRTEFEDVLAAGPWIAVGPTMSRRVILRLHKPGEWATNLETVSAASGSYVDRYSGQYFKSFSDAVMNLTERIKDDLGTSSRPGDVNAP